ncbi:ABC transporter ATP-binding protein [Tsukamurella strandjordii]|uniref:ABC transporter ATP-binding protein n=1 Tax=Tsukamurella strandjordii TaxID=147577 RepID=A0AA90ND64_9ACTN|nr:ABC transporter ATP-binding protein [Tsukamurella strandjordii]MDP0396296.1 ABC transporter ATP-binding protein [Tsukamurella strandjordii]
MNAPLPPHLALLAHDIWIARGEQSILRGIGCEVRSGESLAIVGPSGSGKTTLLHVLAGISVPDRGRVLLAAQPGGRPTEISGLDGEKRAALRRGPLGVVFQSGQLLSELTTRENIALPLMLGGVAGRDAVRAADAVFADLGIEGLQDRRPGEISGGQAQRVALGRALITRPRIVFADEPTGSLDPGTSRAVADTLFSATSRRGASLVVVTHDMSLARRCDRVFDLGAIALAA